MLSAALVAVALVLRLPLGAVGLAWLATTSPVACVAGAAAWGLWNRSRSHRVGPDDEAAFLLAMAAGLKSGHSIHGALVSAAPRTPAVDLDLATRRARFGADPESIADALGAALPVNGRLVSATVKAAAQSGGRLADILSRLATRAVEVGELERERRALTAQARMSAWVVAGIPPVLVGALLATGRIDLTGASGTLVVVGLGLMVVGVGVVVSMVRRTA